MIVPPEILFRYYRIAEDATYESLRSSPETSIYAYTFGRLVNGTNSHDIARAWLLGAMIRTASPEHVPYIYSEAEAY